MPEQIDHLWSRESLEHIPEYGYLVKLPLSLTHYFIPIYIVLDQREGEQKNKLQGGGEYIIIIQCQFYIPTIFLGISHFCNLSI